MPDTIIQQVSEQVKKVMEAANSARPLSHFDYVSTTCYKPSCMHIRTADHEKKTMTGPLERMPYRAIVRARDDWRSQPWSQCHMRRIPDVLAGLRSISKLQGPKGRPRDGGAPLSGEKSPPGTPHFGLWGPRSKPYRDDLPSTVFWGQGPVYVPMAYNIILQRPTLYKVKAVIASYLLQLQFKVDDGCVGKLQ
ncbi:hypothetical protein Cgig2_030557 [Carnegiea gigantea]|uniref:Uncharacterized protein n=1 Tax=Carnegiea gigantea TaxID=171969 RepID=A0A9Q1GXD6_9CARY|nr:hypothetical protein Cgig2_030557 [Carnegiea gigantea]